MAAAASRARTSSYDPARMTSTPPASPTTRAAARPPACATSSSRAARPPDAPGEPPREWTREVEGQLLGERAVAMVHERPPRQPGDDEAGDRGLVVVGVDDVDRVPGDDPPEARRQREIAEDATEART